MRIHFIAGLPRSGSTLLAAILRQNPRFSASIQSPIAEIFASLLKQMSGFSDSSVFISQDQRTRILKSLFQAYYAEVADKNVIFDSNRSWCLHLPALSQLFPECRIVCCIRNPAWILDSIERHVQQNALQPSKVFNYEPTGSVYNRVEQLKSLMVGPSLNALRQAWFSEHARHLIAIRFSSLTERPAEVIQQLYGLLGQEHFEHDFENVEYAAPEFDALIGFPGFHSVARRVKPVQRHTILPPELFRQYDNSFWELPGQNPREISIL